MLFAIIEYLSLLDATLVPTEEANGRQILKASAGHWKRFEEKDPIRNYSLYKPHGPQQPEERDSVISASIAFELMDKLFRIYSKPPC